MNRTHLILLSLLLLLLLLSGFATASPASQPRPSLPLRFEENRGQAGPNVDYVARGPGFSLGLHATGFTLLTDSDEKTAIPLQMNLHAADAAELSGEQPLPTTSNYFLGRDPARWLKNVPNYAAVRYAAIYPGIDLRFYGNAAGRLEYDFIVAPGGDPAQIKMTFSGAESIRVDSQGDLLLETASGVLRQHAPVIYQPASGKRGAQSPQPVAGQYTVSGQDVSLKVGPYDPTRPLVIDPVLVFSTFLGGADNEAAYGLVRDSGNNLYLTGFTYSAADFPSSEGPYDSGYNGNQDVFVLKLSAEGDSVIYATYFGGSDNDIGFDLAVDRGDRVTVTGMTRSDDFPVVADFEGGSFGGSGYHNGGEDAFAFRLNAYGTDVDYSVYLGGSANERGQAVAVDEGGNAYLTGFTFSDDFPVSGGYQDWPGGSEDIFVTKLTEEAALAYSTYVGDTRTDIAHDLVVDAGGQVYVAGSTFSDYLTPYYAGGYQTSNGGSEDAFLFKLNADGDDILFFTYLGGISNDAAYGLALDAGANIYLTGRTYSPGFPTTAGAYDESYNGSEDVFAAKFSPDGSNLIYSTFLGGSAHENEAGLDIGVDVSGQAYLTGYTYSPDFPTLPGSYDTTHNGSQDVFLTRLTPDGDAVSYSTFLGGSGNEVAHALAVDAGGEVYLTGLTRSLDFPTSHESYEATYRGGGMDAFLSKLELRLVPTPTPTSDPGGTVTPTATATSPATVTPSPTATSALYYFPLIEKH